MGVIRLLQGDISAVPADAIVNAANSSLLGGGGVDGAIHAAGGPQILAQCRELRATAYPDGLPVGMAVATTAGRLPARWVIHTVGPVHRGSGADARLLRESYANSLALALSLGATSVSFPAISTGAYGYPVAEAARIALSVLSGAPIAVTVVLWGSRTLAAFREAAAELGVPVSTG